MRWRSSFIRDPTRRFHTWKKSEKKTQRFFASGEFSSHFHLHSVENHEHKKMKSWTAVSHAKWRSSCMHECLGCNANLNLWALLKSAQVDSIRWRCLRLSVNFINVFSWKSRKSLDFLVVYSDAILSNHLGINYLDPSGITNDSESPSSPHSIR